jgi:hypothetical protein
MARLQNRKLVFDYPYEDQYVTKFKVYFTTEATVNYFHPYIEIPYLAGKSSYEIDLQQLPMLSRTNYMIGVSAVSDSNNESDMICIAYFFDQSIPRPPEKLRIVELYSG